MVYTAPYLLFSAGVPRAAGPQLKILCSIWTERKERVRQTVSEWVVLVNGSNRGGTTTSRWEMNEATLTLKTPWSQVQQEIKRRQQSSNASNVNDMGCTEGKLWNIRVLQGLSRREGTSYPVESVQHRGEEGASHPGQPPLPARHHRPLQVRPRRRAGRPAMAPESAGEGAVAAAAAGESGDHAVRLLGDHLGEGVDGGRVARRVVPRPGAARGEEAGHHGAAGLDG